MTNGAMRATAAEVCRNFGHWQDQAMTGPVLVTNHGRPKTVLLSANLWSAGVACGARDEADSAARLALDHMNEAYMAFDERLHIVHANRAAATFLRLTPDALRGQPLATMFPDLAATVVTRILMRVMATGEARQFDAPGAGGTAGGLRVNAFPSRDGVALLFSVIDDDPCVRGAQAQAEALAALLKAHGEAAFATISLRGTFAMLCPALATMIGFRPEQLATARLVDIAAVGQRATIADAVERALAHSETVVVDTALLSRDGDEPPVTIAITPTRGAYAIDGAAVLVTPRRRTAPAAQVDAA